MRSSKIKHISQIAEETALYIDRRRQGEERSLKTRWAKFNEATMNGIEPNCLLTIAGRSGSGKSSVANMIEQDIIELNKDENVVILSFSLEMVGRNQIARKLSSKLNVSTKTLYSTDGSMNDSLWHGVLKFTKEFKTLPISYVEDQCTIDDIWDISREFQDNNQDKWVVIIVDHALLVEGKNDERINIANLQKKLIALKKYGKTSIIQLSQLNRNIEEPQRVTTPALQYPNKADISGSDSIYHASDYVMIIHRPEMMNISVYGVKGLKTENMVFLHILKNREGESKILVFEEQFRYNNMIETTPQQEMFSTLTERSK